VSASTPQKIRITTRKSLTLPRMNGDDANTVATRISMPKNTSAIRKARGWKRISTYRSMFPD
jgi:hypothetical protein